MRTAMTFVITPLLCLLSGCGSTGHHDASVRISPRQPAVILWNDNSFSGRYAPALVAVLEKNGLIVTTNTNSDTLVCTTSIRAGVTMSAQVVLLSGNKPLVTVEAGNAGWGTLLARGAAQDNVINSAIDAFDRELSKVCKGRSTQPTQKVSEPKPK